MDDEKLQDRAPERQERAKETSGEYLLRVLKPAGCILVLILFIAFMTVALLVGENFVSILALNQGR